jgi:acetyl esterase/lipase
MSTSTLEAIFDHLRSIKRRAETALQRGDWDAYRQSVADYGAFRPECMTPVTEVHRVEVDGISCEWLMPKNPIVDTRLLYIHGGAWMAGGLDSHRGLASRIAKASGIPTLTLEYRLAPEHPFPAGLEDCLSTYGWMLEHGPHGAGPCARAFIAGESAGGNLALASLLALKELPDVMPDAAVVLSPATDFTASGASCETRRDQDPVIDHGRSTGFRKSYFPGHKAEEPLISPLFADLAGLPPMLIQVGEAETLLDDSVMFAAKAADAGVDVTLEVWDEMPHVWQFFAPMLDEANAAIESIGNYLAERAE